MKNFKTYITENSEFLVAFLGVITAIINVIPQKENKVEDKKNIQPCTVVVMNMINCPNQGAK